jgi:SsrA-binding protein
MARVDTKKGEHKPASDEKPSVRVITVNRHAFHDYEILERVEAGLVLKGTEIKSVREGMINIRDAYAASEGGELWLFNAHIAPYSKGGPHNHPAKRPRKLLMHRRQMDQLVGRVSQKGFTLVPLRIYVKGGLAKVELGLARGRRQYEKRQVILRREVDREIHREMRRRA